MPASQPQDLLKHLSIYFKSLGVYDHRIVFDSILLKIRKNGPPDDVFVRIQLDRDAFLVIEFYGLWNRLCGFHFSRSDDNEKLKALAGQTAEFLAFAIEGSALANEMVKAECQK